MEIQVHCHSIAMDIANYSTYMHMYVTCMYRTPCVVCVTMGSSHHTAGDQLQL